MLLAWSERITNMEKYKIKAIRELRSVDMDRFKPFRSKKRAMGNKIIVNNAAILMGAKKV
ncbi:hypothetical protein GCM10007049_17630 [Echinicola pacifica]|uniref:Uncharacterized protein n=1 Tax=Echinicola pacifica TaxID=346377 RepID=A0A918PYJ9_9BACT|nr:hypothetical protein GCM10007049_17630 [Echinicola pacifica]